MARRRKKRRKRGQLRLQCSSCREMVPLSRMSKERCEDGAGAMKRLCEKCQRSIRRLYVKHPAVVRRLMAFAEEVATNAEAGADFVARMQRVRSEMTAQSMLTKLVVLFGDDAGASAPNLEEEVLAALEGCVSAELSLRNWWQHLQVLQDVRAAWLALLEPSDAMCSLWVCETTDTVHLSLSATDPGLDGLYAAYTLPPVRLQVGADTTVGAVVGAMASVCLCDMSVTPRSEEAAAMREAVAQRCLMGVDVSDISPGHDQTPAVGFAASRNLLSVVSFSVIRQLVKNNLPVFWLPEGRPEKGHAWPEEPEEGWQRLHLRTKLSDLDPSVSEDAAAQIRAHLVTPQLRSGTAYVAVSMGRACAYPTLLPSS